MIKYFNGQGGPSSGLALSGYLLLGIFTLLLGLSTSWAQDGALPAGEEPDVSSNSNPSPPQANVDNQPAKNVTRKKNRRRYRERSTEGTKAPKQFSAESVIKSEYKINGRRLEVDPD